MTQRIFPGFQHIAAATAVAAIATVVIAWLCVVAQSLIAKHDWYYAYNWLSDREYYESGYVRDPVSGGAMKVGFAVNPIWTRLETYAPSREAEDVDPNRVIQPHDLPHWCYVRAPHPNRLAPEAGSSLWESATGFPFRALRTSYYKGHRDQEQGDLDLVCDPVEWGITASFLTHSGDQWVLPLRPVWPGFIMNVIVYTVAWIMLMTMMKGSYVVVSGYFRLSRGRCARCGYMLVNVRSDVCPECGVAIPWNASRK